MIRVADLSLDITFLINKKSSLTRKWRHFTTQNHKWRCFRRLYSLYSWLEEGKVAFVAGKQTKETSGRADSSSSNEPQRQNVWIRVDYGHGSGSKLRLQKSLFLDNSWRLKIARLVWKNTPKYWLYYHVWQRKRGQRSVIFNINGDRVYRLHAEALKLKD